MLQTKQCDEHCLLVVRHKAGPPRVVLKLNRRHHFLGMPPSWLGEVICSHELSILRHLSHLPQVPRVLSDYGRTGFVYEYIEGRSLQDKDKLPEDFFDRLAALLQQVHRRGVVYLDLNKCSNILVGRTTTEQSPDRKG